MHRAINKIGQVVIIPDELADNFTKAGYTVDEIAPVEADVGTMPHPLQPLADEIRSHIGEKYGEDKIVAMPLAVALDANARDKFHDSYHHSKDRIREAQNADQQAALDAIEQQQKAATEAAAATEMPVEHSESSEGYSRRRR